MSGGLYQVFIYPLATIVVSASRVHFADELRQGYATQVLPHGLFGTLGHAAHDALHVAAHAALP